MFLSVGRWLVRCLIRLRVVRVCVRRSLFVWRDLRVLAWVRRW